MEVPAAAFDDSWLPIVKSLIAGSESLKFRVFRLVDDRVAA